MESEVTVFRSSIYLCNNLDAEFDQEHFSPLIKELCVILFSYSIFLC